MQEMLTYVLLGGLAIALLVAIVTDLTSRTIGNTLNAAIALAAPVFWWASDLSLWPGVAWQLGIAAITFGVCTFFFYIRQMGGGDVKLLTALALWMPPSSFLNLVVIMVMVGWVLTLAMGAWHVARDKHEAAHPLRDIGLLIGCTLIAANFASAVMGGPKLTLPDSVATSAAATDWGMLALAMVPVAILVVVTFTSIRILKRHREAIRVPYGLAIAAGGLWIIAAGDLFAATSTPGLG